MDKDKLTTYTREQYGTELECRGESVPNTFVLCHCGKYKWYTVIIDVRCDWPGLLGEEIVFIVDVKCGPLLSGSHLGKSGIMPAYHMNKLHWLNILLGGSVADATVTELLDLSYNQTQASRKRWPHERRNHLGNHRLHTRPVSRQLRRA